MTVCALDPTFVKEVAEEQETHFVAYLQERIDFNDESLGSLVRLIEEEAKSVGVRGRLYVDSRAARHSPGPSAQG
jgi:hypothetical protein